MLPVLFTSQRPLERCENIKAVYEAYDGPKEFIKLDWYRRSDAIKSGKYAVMVTDEIPTASPGTVIMINHGITGNKLYGLDQPNRYATLEQCKLITYAVTTSPELIPLMSKQLATPEERVLSLGLPRTDAYKGKAKGEGGTGLTDKRVYLFAPTYRGKSERSYTVINWRLIDELLTVDELLLIKPHMLTNNVVDAGYEHIKYVSNKEPSTPYIIDCDVLITDYSSIMLDGLTAYRPVVLFSKDNVYLRARGMYYQYPEAYSSYYCKTERELVDMIRSAVWTKTDDERRAFFASACDGNSTRRVIDLIKRVNV